LIATVLANRFDLAPPERVAPVGEELETVGCESTEIAEAELEDAAVAAIAELTSRQAEVLYRKAGGETLEQIAAALHVSRGTVDNELRRAATIAIRHTGPEENPAQLLEKMTDALS
jgi:DNA-directed RNA polymerase specialized sigma24 family protein